MTDSQLLRRILGRIPSQRLRTTLPMWTRLSREQQQTLDFTQPKSLFTENLLALCEVNGLTVKHITELEMIYVIENPNMGMWHAFQLLDAADDAASVELTLFKEQFKAHLSQVVSHVSIKIKKHTDEGIWIRIAWGDNFTGPNHLKPTYVVHHLQTPYVFVCNLTAKHRPLFNQALLLATRYSSVKDAHLSGRNLTAVKDLLMRQYQQVFPTKYSDPLQEKTSPPTHPGIENEHVENATNRCQMACEAFGDGPLPKLQTAVYKLETKFRDTTNQVMTDRDEPFRAMVKFSSTNLLESLSHAVSSGIASAPVSSLLSSITQKGRNHFVITDSSGPSQAQH